jgi:hypothetical protein
MKPKNRKKPTPKIKKSQAADISLHGGTRPLK